MPRNRKAHDVIHLTNGHKLLVLTNEPHSREYKRLMRKEAKMWQECFDDALIAYGADNQEEALKAFEKKWRIKL